jgi:hypothetical protein
MHCYKVNGSAECSLGEENSNSHFRKRVIIMHDLKLSWRQDLYKIFLGDQAHQMNKIYLCFETVLETSVTFIHLTRLIAQKGFIGGIFMSV